MKAALFKTMINLYPPYLGAGIRIARISNDYRDLLVRMKLRFYNRNYVETHFGGSLYAMIDPFYMLMLMQVLGGTILSGTRPPRSNSSNRAAAR